MKSDGVEDIFKWMKDKCKEQKQVVEQSRKNLEKETKEWSGFDDTQCFIDAAKVNLEREEAKLAAFVEVKIGVEKYMKKLRHQGE